MVQTPHLLSLCILPWWNNLEAIKCLRRKKKSVAWKQRAYQRNGTAHGSKRQLVISHDGTYSNGSGIDSTQSIVNSKPNEIDCTVPSVTNCFEDSYAGMKARGHLIEVRMRKQFRQRAHAPFGLGGNSGIHARRVRAGLWSRFWSKPQIPPSEWVLPASPVLYSKVKGSKVQRILD